MLLGHRGDKPWCPFFMETLTHILDQVGDADSLNGWRLAAFALLMWWSKVLGKMAMLWWEKVKIAQWQKELGLDEQPKKTDRKARDAAKPARASRVR